MLRINQLLTRIQENRYGSRCRLRAQALWTHTLRLRRMSRRVVGISVCLACFSRHVLALPCTSTPRVFYTQAHFETVLKVC